MWIMARVLPLGDSNVVIVGFFVDLHNSWDYRGICIQRIDCLCRW